MDKLHVVLAGAQQAAETEAEKQRREEHDEDSHQAVGAQGDFCRGGFQHRIVD